MRTRNIGPPTPGAPAGSQQSKHLIRRLGSRDAEERRVARDEFVRMATEDPALFHADLADIIKAITGNRKRASIIVSVLAVLFYAVYMASMMLISTPQGMTMVIAMLCAIGILIPIGLTGLGISGAITGQRKKRLAECIADIDDLNALPVLIELLEFTNPAVQNAIITPITRMLLRLRASDAHLLGYLHRTALARALNTPRARKIPTPFFLAVLQAFEHIGDSQVLPTVTWLAQGKGIAGSHPDVQEAARTCEAHLQEMLRRHQAPYLLLRPSSQAEAPQSLLRPVVHAPDAAPQELLRANNSPAYEPQTTFVAPPQAAEQELLPLRLPGYEDP